MRDVCDPEHDARLEAARQQQLEEKIKLDRAVAWAAEIIRLEDERLKASKLIEQCDREIEEAKKNLREMLK